MIGGKNMAYISIVTKVKAYFYEQTYQLDL